MYSLSGCLPTVVPRPRDRVARGRWTPLTRARRPQATRSSTTATWSRRMRRVRMSWTTCRPRCVRAASRLSPSRSASSRCRRSVVSMCSRRPTGEPVQRRAAPSDVCPVPRPLCGRPVHRARGGGRRGGAAGRAAAPALAADGAHQGPAHPTLHLLLRVRSQQQVIEHSASGGRARN